MQTSRQAFNSRKTVVKTYKN